MGTNSHKPSPHKADFHGAHDAATRARGPGERPGVTSRIEAARERLRQRDAR